MLEPSRKENINARINAFHTHEGKKWRCPNNNSNQKPAGILLASAFSLFAVGPSVTEGASYTGRNKIHACMQLLRKSQPRSREDERKKTEWQNTPCKVDHWSSERTPAERKTLRCQSTNRSRQTA
mmetsp:Transcript_37055/g.72885  ORF Transcript_37055/g.72885 Transcript_37055/m.72885 type:complete len:125 (-) Transcript_37055:4721-5095(-)